MFFAVLFNSGQTLRANFPATQSATLVWNPSPSADVVSYALCYGTNSGVYTYTNSTGLATTTLVTNLQTGTTYYFVVVGVGSSGTVGLPSSEIIYAASNTSATNPVVSWLNPANIGYGVPLGTNQLNATANVLGSFVYAPPSGSVLSAGNAQTLSATFTPQDGTDYNDVTTMVTVNILTAPLTITTATVTPAALTITADNASKVYGATLPTLTATYTGFVNNNTASSLGTAVTLSTTVNASSPVGSYTITASGAVGTNYSIAYINGLLTVLPTVLAITRSGNNILVSWPGTGNGVLQQNPNLGSTAGWVTCGSAITSNANGTNSITFSPLAGNLFFRLVNP